MKITSFIKQSFLSFILLCVFLNTQAQDGTRYTKKTDASPVGKVMTIPFEPKLYLSEIDKKVNEQTHWDFNQIREYFRHQLDAQLQAKLKNQTAVISFYSDSVKMSKDLKYIYSSTRLSFDPLEKTGSSTTGTSKDNGIKDGQLAVEMSSEKKFTNLRINDLQALTYLHDKYKAEYFIFINQLDIKNDADSYNISTDTYLRRVNVHYTILDKNGKLITAGIAPSSFSSKENNPKKIVAQSFSPAATYIATKLITILKPLPQKK